MLVLAPVLLLLSLVLVTEVTTAPASRPAGHVLKQDVPAEVHAAWQRVEVVRAANLKAILAKLTPLKDDLRLISEGRIDRGIQMPVVIESPIRRYVFKAPGIKAEYRG